MGLIRSTLATRPVQTLTTPHHLDHYLARIHPMWTVKAVRAKVVSVEPETGSASTVLLRPNGAWKGFRPGQHVEFGVEVDGVRKVRVFSVSSSAWRRDGLFSVSVKAHPNGFVSQFLQRDLTPGTVVHLSQAQGEFTLPADVPEHVLMLSGGSGITPVMSMLSTLSDPRSKHTGHVTFVHYARSRRDEMFAAELDRFAQLPNVTMVRVYTREPRSGAELAGRYTIDHLQQLRIDPRSTLTFVCGPAGLIAAVRDSYEALGAQENLRQEYFKVPTLDPELLERSAAEATGTLTFDTSQARADNSGATILEQAEAAGLTPDFGCRMGVCNTCAVKKMHGAVRHVISGEVCANTDETIKPCVNVPVGDVTVAL